MTTKAFGLVLLILVGLAISSLLFTRSVAQVINASFTLSPGGIYGPYDGGTYPIDNRTYPHTRLFVKSTLEGKVAVEGGSIRLTMRSNVEKLASAKMHGQCTVYVDRQYVFSIKPAHDQYTFTFQNTGSAQSQVAFTLTEICRASPVTLLAWLLTVLAFLFLRPSDLLMIALILTIVGIVLRSRSRRGTMPPRSSIAGLPNGLRPRVP